SKLRRETKHAISDNNDQHENMTARVNIEIFVFFFFSSRRRHTRWPRDWSSDVCSSDLSRKMAAAIAKGTQPPERIFSMFAAKNGTSTHKNSPATTAARAKLQRHTSRLIT